MNWFMILFVAVLFFLLTPGVLLRLPARGDVYTVAAVHAAVFALVWHFTHKAVWRVSMSY
jgi:hypothetical protein